MRILLNSDTAWLLNVAEHMLTGKIYGLDIIETNPPASALLYFPAVLLGRFTGLTSDTACIIYVLLLAALSNIFVLSLFKKHHILEQQSRWPVIVVMVFLTIFFPSGFFAQKEHLVLLLILPFLATATIEAKGNRPRSAERILAGAGLGLVLCVKPHFILVPLFIGLYDFYKSRTFKAFIRTEYNVAALILAGYAVMSFTVFSYYLNHVVPELITIYALANLPFLQMLLETEGAIYLIFLLFFFFLCRKSGTTPFQKITLLASIGFYCAFLLQGKGYPYQLYPAVSCLFLAFSGGLSFNPAQMAKNSLNPFVTTGILFLFIALFSRESLLIVARGLIFDLPQQVRILADLKEKPRVAGFVTSTASAFPLVRAADGQWVLPSAYILSAQMFSPEILEDIQRGNYEDPMIQSALKQIRDTSNVIMQEKPDILLMDNSPLWQELVLHEAGARAVLDQYEEAEWSENMIFYKRIMTQ